jgi:hypothetical protein
MLAPEAQLSTGFAALLGGHLLPSMPIRHHAIALRWWELLELLVSLHHLVTLIRRQTSPACIVVLQFIAPSLG